MNIRVVREAGGIGDIVRVIPVLRGLREKFPSARLWVFAPDMYKPLLRGWYDEFRATPWHGRRPRDTPLDEKRWPYLNVGVRFDSSIGLYCPAFRHEQRQGGNVWLDRIELFCRAADVTPSDLKPHVNLDPSDVTAAREYVKKEGLRNGRQLIALQPFSTDPGRNWPTDNWKRLADVLEWLGYRLIVFDGCRGRTNRFRQHRVIGKPLGFVAALLKECDLLVAPDSGLGHLAAAVDTPALGLFASQSPGVIYRHYPLHGYIYPPWDGQERCRWPCYWRRPAECTRSALMKAGKTCPMLARVTVEYAYDAITARLESDCIQERAPVRSGEMPAETAQTLGPCEKINEIPIPQRDFALERIALTRATDDLAPVLHEAYRVLKPGGFLFMPGPPAPELARLIRAQGFSVSRHAREQRALACSKLGTWPCDGRRFR